MGLARRCKVVHGLEGVVRVLGRGALKKLTIAAQ